MIGDVKGAGVETDAGLCAAKGQAGYHERVKAENLERIKDMSLRHRVPSVVAVQSKRDVDDYSGLRIPGLADAQWASSIEQTADKIFGLTRPVLYMEDGTQINVKNDGEESAYLELEQGR